MAISDGAKQLASSAQYSSHVLRWRNKGGIPQLYTVSARHETKLANDGSPIGVPVWKVDGECARSRGAQRISEDHYAGEGRFAATESEDREL